MVTHPDTVKSGVTVVTRITHTDEAAQGYLGGAPRFSQQSDQNVIQAQNFGRVGKEADDQNISNMKKTDKQ